MKQDIDSKALEFSRQVMALIYGPLPKGGYVQLQAQIQCIFAESSDGQISGNTGRLLHHAKKTDGR